MKKTLLLSAAALLAGALAFTGVEQVAVAKAEEAPNYIYGENLIPNGDFAVGAGEVAIGKTDLAGSKWAKYLNWNNAESTQVAVADPTNADNTVLRFTTYEGAGFSSMFILLTIPTGVEHTLSFDFLNTVNSDNIGIAFWNVTDSNRVPELNVLNSADVTNNGATITDGENGWKHVEWKRTFTEGKTFDSAHIWANVKNGSIYIDNLSAKDKDGNDFFVGGDFEGILDYAKADVASEPGPDGIYGIGAALGNNCVNIAKDGFYGIKKGFAAGKYEIKAEFEGALKAQFLDEEDQTIGEYTLENGVGQIQDLGGAAAVKFLNAQEEATKVTSLMVRQAVESSYDPNKTYYELENLTVNGDFEAFEVGTRFSESQQEGAWGSLASYDNPARIMEVGGSKCAVIGKIDETDTKVFSSMFLMTPPTLEIGDILRIKYDAKLTHNDDLDSYQEICSSLVGGANVEYYEIDLAGALEFTSGAEKAHYPIKTEALENGFTRITLDFEVTNDIIQWNSLRWLYTAHSVGETLAIDNVELHLLSDTEPTNPITGLEIVGGDKVLNEGETYQLEVNATPEGHDEETLTYTSSNSEVATVSETGLVTAVKEGSTKITVETANGVKAEIIVTVQAKAAPAQGGCGGSIVAISSLSVSVLALAGALIIRKKKEQK